MNTMEKINYISRLYIVMINNINEEEDLINSNIDSVESSYIDKLQSISKRLNDFKYKIAACMLEFERNRYLINALQIMDIVESTIDLDKMIESLKQDIKSNEHLKQSLYIIIKKGRNQM